MPNDAGYWGQVIAARVQAIPPETATTDDGTTVPSTGGLRVTGGGIRVTAELFTDCPERFQPDGLVRVGVDLPAIGGVQAGFFMVEEAELEMVRPLCVPVLTVRMRSVGPVMLGDPMAGVVPPKPPLRPLSITPPPPPPARVPVARPTRRAPAPPPDPPTYDPPGRRINLDE